jgi:mRNA interferase RelE/StbE
MSPEKPRAFVRLIDPAISDLRRLAALDPQIVRWSLKNMLLLERDPNAGRPLLGELIGWRKLVVRGRDWRIVWQVTTDIAGNEIVEITEVWAIGARADAEVYAELRARVKALEPTAPTTALAEVIRLLGRSAGSVVATPEPLPADPVPPWLVVASSTRSA